jgi:hypothetical protein
LSSKYKFPELQFQFARGLGEMLCSLSVSAEY